MSKKIRSRVPSLRRVMINRKNRIFSGASMSKKSDPEFPPYVGL
jgi:hypothetical protein